MMAKIPILKIGEVLIASIQTELTDRSAVQFKEDLLAAIARHSARGVIIDLTAVGLVDSFLGRILSDLAQMARLMGAQVVITGLQPEVAITLLELGLDLPGVRTALNLERGLALLQEEQAATRDRR
jgi:rsbT antagonist protein RsbS